MSDWLRVWGSWMFRIFWSGRSLKTVELTVNLASLVWSIHVILAWT